MVGGKKWAFFFGPKNPDFGPKIRFFVWDPVFWQSGARNPRRWFRFGTFGSSVRLFVSELRPFSRGEPGRRAQKSYPTPLLGHRLPVTALALSAPRPFGPARFLRGLYNSTNSNNISEKKSIFTFLSVYECCHDHEIFFLDFIKFQPFNRSI